MTSALKTLLVAAAVVVLLYINKEAAPIVSVLFYVSLWAFVMLFFIIMIAHVTKSNQQADRTMAEYMRKRKKAEVR